MNLLNISSIISKMLTIQFKKDNNGINTSGPSQSMLTKGLSFAVEIPLDHE